ncbi:hypothetical protein LB507_000857, partial [Fusarium sp. FIESC RH6]
LSTLRGDSSDNGCGNLIAARVRSRDRHIRRSRGSRVERRLPGSLDDYCTRLVALRRDSSCDRFIDRFCASVKSSDGYVRSRGRGRCHGWRLLSRSLNNNCTRLTVSRLNSSDGDGFSDPVCTRMGLIDGDIRGSRASGCCHWCYGDWSRDLVRACMRAIDRDIGRSCLRSRTGS